MKKLLVLVFAITLPGLGSTAWQVRFPNVAGSTGVAKAASAIGVAGWISPGKAAIWSFTGRLETYLSSTGSQADSLYGASALDVVGYVRLSNRIEAALWRKEDPSVMISLHPANALRSLALGTDGAQQVGHSVFNGNTLHAGLWTGSAGSWVDLNPSQATSSEAFAVASGTQVGYIQTNGKQRAARWNNTPGSWVDLHPANAPFSIAYAINGEGIVGEYSTNQGSQAAIWDLSSNAITSLNSGNWPTSSARAITAQCIGGWVADSSGLNRRAVVWRSPNHLIEDLHAALPASYVGSEVTGLVSDSSGIYAVGRAFLDQSRGVPVIWFNPSE